MRKPKTIKMTITVEMEIERMFVSDESTLKEDLMGEFAKIKSGLYENAACGFVTAVDIKQ